MGKGGESAARLVKSKDEATKFTFQEIQKHRVPEDAWMIYNDKVYDVSNWHEHPGGGVIFTHAGEDMTDIFKAFHAAGSHFMLRKFYIGEVEKQSMGKDARQIAFEQGYRDLRAQMVKIGLFDSSKAFYVYKYISNLSIWATGMILVALYPDNMLAHIASALLLAIFMQQCGWLAHDHLHHQVFAKRKYGDWGGLFWGGVCQGYSSQWWKNKHNGHHAVTNLHSSSAVAHDGDPDIDTMPLLAWSLKQAQSFREMNVDGTDSAVVKFFISHQAILYCPILLLARLSWMNESAKLAFGLGAASGNAEWEMKHRGLQYPFWEKAVIVIHYIWSIAVCTGYFRWSIGYSLAFFLLKTCSCGFFLGVVFGLGHNGMPTYDADARPDFWKLQVTTTRNITGGHGIPQCFVDWFCGGLQYQVEHHLFPSMPRHNAARAHELVESFCKEWGVTYHETDLVDGTIEVISHLKDVSNDFVMEFVLDGPTM